MSEQHEEKWFCLRSQLKREGIAAAHLRTNLGLEVFCPRLRFRRATQRGPVWFNESLFPNYLFARFDPAPMFRQVRHALGVSDIVHFGREPATVPDSEIDMLRSAMGDAETLTIEGRVEVGQAVKVT